MTDNSHLSRIAPLAMVFVLVVSAFAGGGAATAAIDSETATTTYQSEIVEGTVIQNITGNTSTEHVVTVKSDSNETKVVLLEDGHDYEVASNASGVNVDHNVSGNEDNWLNHTFTNGDMLDVEHAPGENVTMVAKMSNNTSVDAADAQTANVTFYAEFNNDTSTEVITDAEVDDGDIVEVTEDNTSVLGYELRSKDNSLIEAEDKQVPEETMYVVASNDTVATDMTDVLDEFEAEATASSVLSFFGPNGLAKVSDGDKTVYVPVYAEEAPEDAGDTYAVITEDIGGSTGVEVHGLTEEFDAGDDVDVTMAFGTGTSGWTVGYLTQGLTSFGATLTGGFAGAGIFLAPASLARREQRTETEA